MTSSPTTTTAARSSATAVALLFVGVASVGAAAVLIRLAAAHPLTTSWIRLAVGAVVLVVVALARQRPWPRGADLVRAVAAGVLLAAHFGMWIASLSSTTVTASVVLVCLQPIFVVAIARVFLREPVAPRIVVGIVVALVGAVVIAADAGDVDGGAGSFAGNALAVGGAVAIACYVLVLRTQQADVLATSAVITTAAALTILPVALAFGAPLTPQDGAQALWLMALALGPQVIGHTALNAALRRLPASVVSGGILGEPVIAAVLAWIVLDERIGPATVVGGVVTLAGVVVLLRAQTTTAATATTTSAA